MASEFRQEEEWEDEEEDDASSFVEEIPPTLSLLFGGLLLVGFGRLGDRSWDEGGLGSGRFLSSRLTVSRICLTEKCVMSPWPGLEAEEPEEYRSDT